MRPDVTLREANTEDSLCLAALSIQTWLQTYAIQGIRPTIARYVRDHLTPAAFEAQIRRTDALTIVAMVEDHLVGFAVLETDRPCPVHVATAHLDKLFVQEPFLGQGIGFGLLSRAKAEARDRGHSSGLWLTVNSENRRAQEFYARQGFSDLGRTHFDLYGEKHENRILHTPVADP